MDKKIIQSEPWEQSVLRNRRIFFQGRRELTEGNFRGAPIRKFKILARLSSEPVLVLLLPKVQRKNEKIISNYY